MKGTRGGYPVHSDVLRFVCTSYMQGRGTLQAGVVDVSDIECRLLSQAMHELSIAMSIVETAQEEAERRGVR